MNIGNEATGLDERVPIDVTISLATEAFRHDPIEVKTQAVIKDGKVVSIEQDIEGTHMRNSETWESIMSALKNADIHGFYTPYQTNDGIDFEGDFSINKDSFNNAIRLGKIVISEDPEVPGYFDIQFPEA